MAINKQPLQKFYTGPASILRDLPVLTTVSTFLQCTKDEIIDALLLRRSESTQEAGKMVGGGYYHHQKPEKGKIRYITQPLPLLRKLQDQILFMIQGIEDTKNAIRDELVRYGKNQGFPIDAVVVNKPQEGVRFSENPKEKTALHARHDHSSYFIHLDLAKAFPSFSEEKIYTKLGEILDHQSKIKPLNSLSQIELQKATAIIAHLLSYDNSLATGSPASPFLFHTVLTETDKKLVDKLKSLPLGGVVFTRYADNIIVSFSKIQTPSSQEVDHFFKQLLHIASTLVAKNEIFCEEILDLPLVLPQMFSFFSDTTPTYSDNYARKIMRQSLKHTRDLLLLFKNIFADFGSFNVLFANKSGESRFQRSLSILQESLPKSIHNVIGALDRYKRLLDTTEANYDVTIDSVSQDIQDIIQQDGRGINKSKIEIRHPDSPAMSSMLGLGINNSKSITVPTRNIQDKISFYKGLLSGSVAVPSGLKDDKTGELSYIKLFLSIQGYKEYVLSMKKTYSRNEKYKIMRSMKEGFSKKVRQGFEEIEELCVSRMGLTREQAYDLYLVGKPRAEKQDEIPTPSPNDKLRERQMISNSDMREPERRNYEQQKIDDESEAPIDTRDIPRELAESNQTPLPFDDGPQEDQTQKDDVYDAPAGDPLDDLPF